ncbi:hypothetical protein [Saccharopolyspora phatthalungensis]|uniref:Protein-S-isoprenylcysteine O-methyltransferase Ste14 n=1 Tax=Saccharopolyspora phatthalungensis TaxID=664693 RepID=A0A840QAB0_9PSEU|nr:hypothetical protein [Saccharopolyspora phatthalungensis]MBB5156887.1 protein-S-isoprenylcysteine O-methyltransferase Ste14 [Saccharopolyspora phatthalungensis]
MILFPAMLDHVNTISPAKLKARNIGFYAAGVNIVVLATPVVFLPLSTVLSSQGSWAVVAGFTAVGMISIVGLSSSRKM